MRVFLNAHADIVADINGYWWLTEIGGYIAWETIKHIHE